MLYYLGRFIMWFAVKVHFKSISVFGSQNIPAGKPVIIISNHSASFLDAILLGVSLKRQLYYYARSDVFKSGPAHRLMKAIHMIPIYNMEHSKDDLHRNVETFDEGEKALARKKMLVIFPEGISRQERILLPLKKGTARVAVHAAAQQGFDMGLEIIPIGINYSFHRFRADVTLTVGESTPISSYQETHIQNPNKAISAITRDIEKKFADTVIFVSQANRTEMINQLLVYFKNDFEKDNRYLKSTSLIKQEKEICSIVSAMDDTEANVVEQQVLQYSKQLKESGIDDQEVIGNNGSVPVKLLGIFLGIPIAVGAIPALPIVFLAKWIGDKTVTRKDFYTSVTVSAGGFAFFFYWILCFIIIAFSGGKYLLYLVLSMPICMYLFFHWIELLQSVGSYLRLMTMRKQNTRLYEELKSSRQSFSFWRNRTKQEISMRNESV